MVLLLPLTDFFARLRAGTDTWLRRRLLREARKSCQAELAYLDRRRLTATEQGWADEWHYLTNDLRDNLAQIEQELAAC